MTDEQPIWRIALKDEQHPLHRATWILFSKNMKVEKATVKLEEKRDIVIPLILAILEDQSLEYESALGSGSAPINAIKLSGEWQVEEALPHFYRILVDEEHREDTSVMWDRVVHYLPRFGEVVVEKLLALIDQYPDVGYLFLSLLGEAAPGNEQVFNMIQAAIEAIDGRAKFASHDIDYMSNALLKCDRDKGLAYVQNVLQKRKLNTRSKNAIRGNIEYYMTKRDEE
jgi:hypothetical protein